MDKKNGNQTDSTLSGRELRDAVQRTAPGAAVVFEAIRIEAEEELKRPNRALFMAGLAAGLSMGFSFIAEALLHSGLPETDWRPLVSKFGYSVGFLIVILGRQQLFTENTLTPVLELLQKKTSEVLIQTLRLWTVVLAANFTGTLLFAMGLVLADMFSASQTDALDTVAVHAVAGGFGITLVRAIFAGWLIALMVWLQPCAETARIWVIIILTYLVGIGGFPHIIAGSTEAFYAVLTGTVSLSTAIGEFILPTLIGNIIGGVAMVAVLNYAQAMPAEDL